MRERMVLPFSLQLEECSFYLFKTRLFTLFPLETLRYTLVAKSLFSLLKNNEHPIRLFERMEAFAVDKTTAEGL